MNISIDLDPTLVANWCESNKVQIIQARAKMELEYVVSMDFHSARDGIVFYYTQTTSKDDYLVKSINELNQVKLLAEFGFSTLEIVNQLNLPRMK